MSVSTFEQGRITKVQRMGIFAKAIRKNYVMKDLSTIILEENEFILEISMRMQYK